MMTIPLRGFWDQHRIFSLLLVLFLLILSIFGTFHNLFCTFLSIFCPILSIFLLFFVHFLPNLSCFCIFCPSYFTKVHESKGCLIFSHIFFLIIKTYFFLIIYIKLTIHIVEFYYLEIIFRYLTPLLPNMVNKASKWNWTPTPSNLAYIIL